jgi:ABC-2 type transport system permease protein
MSTVRYSLRRDVGLAGWQVLYEQRAFWRNRVRAWFTFVLPLMFLVIFSSIFHGAHLKERGGISYDTFFIPGILAYGVITTTFVNMAVSTAVLRDAGVLKRMQGTPIPRWAYLAGRIGSTLLVVATMTALTLLLAATAYNVSVRASTLPGLLAALVLGTAVFTTLGIGIVRFIPNADAAAPVANIAILPLTFISGVWFVPETLSPTLRDIAHVFPIQPLADAVQYAFDPRTHGAGLRTSDLRTLAIWLVVGSVLMLRFLRRPQGGDA